ncbi:MAG: 3-deoxy-D-manno-octulosonic acid transferase [Ignavibacteriae bacterium]|nr:3-deoxy-D-manno-octulosonic acid transferase [Ignavibacteriota bacterium]
MKSGWFYFYNIFVLPLLKTVIYSLSVFNKKIKEGIDGRNNLFIRLEEQIQNIDRSKKLFWFHSSSMGEFEQAKPIIKKLKETTDINIVVTFFSPSGYNHSLKYPYADIITYLPYDSVKNSQEFIKLVQPNKVIFMRYDYWPNIVWALKEANIPTFIVDATMDKNSKRKLLFVKQFHISLFKNFEKILTISDDDEKSFMDFELNSTKLLTVGDTRFDRVYQKSLAAKTKNLFNKEIVTDKKVLVLGSTWEEDEAVLLPVIKKIFKYDDNVIVIIAPHEPSPSRLEDLEYSFTKFKTIRFSYMNNYSDEKIILIDSIGILLTLYHYAHIAFVGGSFKQKIHNVLEPAVYGIPVTFGPKNKNSQEALTMINKGCGLVLNNKKDTYKTIKELLVDDNKREQIGNIAIAYVKQNIGATEKIIKEIM